MSRSFFTTQKFTTFLTSLTALSRTFSFEYSELPTSFDLNSDKYQPCNSWNVINKDVLNKHAQYIVQHISSNQQIIGIYVITQDSVNVSLDSLKQYANLLFKSCEDDFLYINPPSKLILFYSNIKTKSNTVKEIINEENNSNSTLTNVNVKPLKVIPNLSKDIIITHHLSINCVFDNKQSKEERFNQLMNIIKQYCININNNTLIINNNNNELSINYPPFIPEDEKSEKIENGMLLRITGDIFIPLLISKINNNNIGNIRELLSDGIYRSLLGRFYINKYNDENNNKEFYEFLMNGGSFSIPLSNIYKSNENTSFRCVLYSSNDDDKNKKYNLLKLIYNEDIIEDRIDNELKEVNKIENTIINQPKQSQPPPPLQQQSQKPTDEVKKVQNKNEEKNEEIKQKSIDNVNNSISSGKNGSNLSMYIVLATVTAIMSLILFFFTKPNK